MKILSIDTTSNVCSVAVLEDDKLICELNSTDMKTHSEKLMPLLDDVLKKAGISLNEINYIACGIGPRFFYRNQNWYCNCKSDWICSFYSTCWNYFS